MKVSLLVPCYNEEKLIEKCVLSCLNQTRKFDNLVFIDDSSTDRTPEILARYADKIIIKRTPKNSGNKSYAQEYGWKFITGDIVATTDADTILDPNFAEEIVKDFLDSNVAAVAGYVRSAPYNWLTLCRAFDYALGQNLHKLAQSYMNYIFVMPGAASAFRADVFRKHIKFDHDTITEDLDFTYQLHRKGFKISYNRNAFSFTQDPTTLKAYINQMRRWYGGGWQNLIKHHKIALHPVKALELSLIYIEGLIFSVLLFLIPMLNPWLGIKFIGSYLSVAFFFGVWTAWIEKRPALVFAPFPYILLVFINAVVFIEQFVKEVVLKRKNLIWFKPERVST